MEWTIVEVPLDKSENNVDNISDCRIATKLIRTLSENETLTNETTHICYPGMSNTLNEQMTEFDISL